MHKLENIAERIRHNFDVRTAKRDEALKQARQLTRACSLAIRAVHRDDKEGMEANLAEAQVLADQLRAELKDHPELFYAGYTQDSLKEFVEANVTCALIQNQPLQTPEELGVEEATDLARGIIEKTRGDVTFSLRGEHLTEAIRNLSVQLSDGQIGAEETSGLSIPINEDD